LKPNKGGRETCVESFPGKNGLFPEKAILCERDGTLSPATAGNIGEAKGGEPERGEVET